MRFNTKFILSLSLIGIILTALIDNSSKSNFNTGYISAVSVVTMNGQSENTTIPETLKEILNKREILRKYFPHWKRRVEYQEEQEKIYTRAMLKKKEIHKLRILDSDKLYTKQELDAIKYFEGTGIYNYYQNVQIPPNIFDTQSSFLLKVEKNKEMRETFLKSYNQIKTEN